MLSTSPTTSSFNKVSLGVMPACPTMTLKGRPGKRSSKRGTRLSRSDWASATEIPGLSRPIPSGENPPRLTRSGSSFRGNHNSVSDVGASKRGGMTPTTRNEVPSSTTFRPRTLSWAPKRCCQRRWLMTSTSSAPGRSSSSVIARP